MPGRKRSAKPNEPPRRVFVDSGGWIALLSARDQHHGEADRLFRLAVGQRTSLYTSNLVLSEVHRLLLYRAGVRAASLALRRMTEGGVQVVFAVSPHHAAAMEWLENLSSLPLTYADAVSFAIMGALKCTTVLGFDQHFPAAGFELWRERE